MRNRIMSCFLVLVLCFSMLPANEVALGNTLPTGSETALLTSGKGIITDWTWADNSLLTDGKYVVENVTAENPAEWETIVTALPKKITAIVQDKEEPVELDVTSWVCAGFNGTIAQDYTVQPVIATEGYTLADTAPALALTVRLNAPANQPMVYNFRNGINTLGSNQVVSYVDFDGSFNRKDDLSSQATYTVISNQTIWDAGWYVVNSPADANLSINSRITINGDVKLILADDCKLMVKGIDINGGGSLTVYGQTSGTGELISNGETNQIGIDGGSLTIYGGKVNAAGGTGSGAVPSPSKDPSLGRHAGKGGYGVNSTITLVAGALMVTGGTGGSGISAYHAEFERGADGGHGIEGKLTMVGGTLQAIGGNGGWSLNSNPAQGNGMNGTTTISGGLVTATGTQGIAGDFSTGANGDAVIYATSIANHDNAGSWSGFIFEDGSGNTKVGTVYGSQTLTANMEIPSNEILTIPKGATLTIPASLRLTNQGVMIVQSEEVLNNSGEITNENKITFEGSCVFQEASQLINTNTGEIIIRGNLTIPTNAELNNQGVLKVEGKVTGTITGNQPISILNNPQMDTNKTVYLRVDSEKLQYSYDNTIWNTYTGSVIFTGDATTNKIQVNSGTHNIVMRDCELGTKDRAIDIAPNATAKITLQGSNTINGKIHVPATQRGYSKATLEITEESAGTLLVNGGNVGYGAGIGSENGTPGATVDTGTIKLRGGEVSVHIGSSYGIGGAIGQGRWSADGDVEIANSTVIIKADNLDWGHGKIKGRIRVTDAFIVAKQELETDSRNGWSGIIIECNKYDRDSRSTYYSSTVYGSPTLKSNATIPNLASVSVSNGQELTVAKGKTLTIADGATLTIASGAVLRNQGTIVVESGGKLINEGAILNSGTMPTPTSGSGSVASTESTVTVTTKNSNGTEITSAKYGDTISVTATMTEKNKQQMLSPCVRLH